MFRIVSSTFAKQLGRNSSAVGSIANKSSHILFAGSSMGFSHYPLSTVVTKSGNFMDLLDKNLMLNGKRYFLNLTQMPTKYPQNFVIIGTTSRNSQIHLTISDARILMDKLNEVVKKAKDIELKFTGNFPTNEEPKKVEYVVKKEGDRFFLKEINTYSGKSTYLSIDDDGIDQFANVVNSFLEECERIQSA